MAEEIKFEKAMEKLEKIVTDLETGDLPLDEALKKYEEGVLLAGMCQKKLTQAEKKIEILSKGLDGSLKAEPFEFEEGAEEALSGKKTSKGNRKKAGQEDAEGGKDLLV